MVMGVRVLAKELGTQGHEAPLCLAGRGTAPSECCGGPTGYRLMLKRQQDGESAGYATELLVASTHRPGRWDAEH